MRNGLSLFPLLVADRRSRTGEAGIDAWLEATNSRFPDWHMYISSRLTDTEYAAGKVLEAVHQRQNTHFDDCLHLAVSMRSFRAENVRADCSTSKLADRYSIAVTRDLSRRNNGFAPMPGERSGLDWFLFESSTSQTSRHRYSRGR